MGGRDRRFPRRVGMEVVMVVLPEVRVDMVMEEDTEEVVDMEEVGMGVHRPTWVDTMIVDLLRDIMDPRLIEENDVIVIEGIGPDREIGPMDDGNGIVVVEEDHRIPPRLIGDTKGVAVGVITVVGVDVGIVGIGETISRTVEPPSCRRWNCFPCLGKRFELALPHDYISRRNRETDTVLPLEIRGW